MTNVEEHSQTCRFTKLPTDLQDAYWRDEITRSMYEVMGWLLRRADWSTGRVQQVTAPTIHHQTGRKFSIRTIRDAMANLEACGWITSHHVPGRRGWYWVTLHNYGAASGAMSGEVLNPKNVIAYRHAEPAECRDECPETSSETSSDGAPIRETTEPTEPLEPPQTAAEFSQCTPEGRSTQDIESHTSVPESGAGADDVLALMRRFQDGESLRLGELENVIALVSGFNRKMRADIATLKAAKASEADIVAKRARLRDDVAFLAKLKEAATAERCRLKTETAASRLRSKKKIDELRASNAPVPSPAAEALARAFAETHSTEYYPADARLLEPMAAKYPFEVCKKAFRFMVGHKFWGDKSATFLSKSKDGKPWFVKLVEDCQRLGAKATNTRLAVFGTSYAPRSADDFKGESL